MLVDISCRTEEQVRCASHLALFYENDEEQRSLVTWFIRQGLERDEKVLYLADSDSRSFILDHLGYDGLEGVKYERNGQLCIHNALEAFVSQGVFKPQRMIRKLEAEVEKARTEGYSSLRVTGEMTWALLGISGSERLIEYESGLNVMQTEGRYLQLCQYDRRRFPPTVLLYVLSAHPAVFLGKKLYENTFYGIMPSYPGHGTATSTLHNWLNHLATDEVQITQ